MKETSLLEMTMNPIAMIGGEWWLIAAGNETGYNAMTASWGHIGSLWGRPERRSHMGLPTAVIYVRPQRYTKEFLDREDGFTLSVFPPAYQKALAYLGSHSGRDGDKIAAAGLTPAFKDGTVYFQEAKTVFFCKKLYHAPLTEAGFVDRSLIDANYPERDFHEIYIGEIVKALVAES